MADVPNRVDPRQAELEERDSLKIRLRELFNRAFQFKEHVWGDDEKFWEDAAKHPLKFKARFADQTNIFSKPWAAKLLAEREGAGRPSGRMTAEKLEELGLNDAQIEKLATVGEADGDDKDS